MPVKKPLPLQWPYDVGSIQDHGRLFADKESHLQIAHRVEHREPRRKQLCVLRMYILTTDAVFNVHIESGYCLWVEHNAAIPEGDETLRFWQLNQVSSHSLHLEAAAESLLKHFVVDSLVSPRASSDLASQSPFSIEFDLIKTFNRPTADKNRAILQDGDIDAANDVALFRIRNPSD